MLTDNYFPFASGKIEVIHPSKSAYKCNFRSNKLRQVIAGYISLDVFSCLSCFSAFEEESKDRDKTVKSVLWNSLELTFVGRI